LSAVEKGLEMEPLEAAAAAYPVAAIWEEVLQRKRSDD
jgi:hypothetical protein